MIVDDEVEKVLKKYLELQKIEKIEHIIEQTGLDEKYESDEELKEKNKMFFGEEFEDVKGSKQFFIAISNLGFLLLEKFSVSFTKEEFLTSLLLRIINYHLDNNSDVLYFAQNNDLKLSESEFNCLYHKSNNEINIFISGIKSLTQRFHGVFEMNKSSEFFEQIVNHSTDGDHDEDTMTSTDDDKEPEKIELEEDDDESPEHQSKEEDPQNEDDDESSSLKDEAYDDFDDIFVDN